MMFKPKFQNQRTESFYEILKRLYFICIFAYLPLLMIFTLIEDLKAGSGFLDLGYWLPLLLYIWVTFPFYGFFIASGLAVNGLLTIKTRNYKNSKIKLIYLLAIAVAIVMGIWNILIFVIDLPSFLNVSYILSPVVAIAEIIFLLVLQKKLAKNLTEETPSDDTFSRKNSVIKNTITAVIITVSILAILFVPYETIRYADGGTVKTNALAYTVVEWNRGKNVDVMVSANQEDLQYADEEQHTCFYFFPHNFKSYDELWDMKH